MADLNARSLPDLFTALVADGCLDRLLDAALAEDLGSGSGGGDITSRSIIDANATAQGAIVARNAGVVAGLAAMPSMAKRACGAIRIEIEIADGQPCQAGDSIAQISGNLRQILRLERTILNFLGRLCGVATATRQYVDAINGTKAVICDTRKTTPGLRNLEKYAVRCGGGTLHRLGLFDAVLYKDNHLATIPPGKLAQQLAAATQNVRKSANPAFVEVEVDTLDQLQQILRMERKLIDIILLDNMSIADLRKAVEQRDKRAPHIQLEASGGITLMNVRAVAETGVDRIAIGAITHSAPSLDLGLDFAHEHLRSN